jgi:outer membrane protein assembly factor BamB
MCDIGYHGCPIWSSSPAICILDYFVTPIVYVSTGDNYDIPASVLSCINRTHSASCGSPRNFDDSIVLLNFTDGNIIAGHQFAGNKYQIDAFNLNCNYGLPCPTLNGTFDPDSDFASGVMVVDTIIRDRSVRMACAGSKNGIFYCLDHLNGSLIWNTIIGPISGSVGGIMFGSAYDGQRCITIQWFEYSFQRL